MYLEKFSVLDPIALLKLKRIIPVTLNNFHLNFERMYQQYQGYISKIQRTNELYNESVKMIERMNEIYKEFIKSNEKMNEVYKQYSFILHYFYVMLT